MWSAAAIDAALTRLDAALFDSRRHGAIADEVVGHALQAIAYTAAAARR